MAKTHLACTLESWITLFIYSVQSIQIKIETTQASLCMHVHASMWLRNGAKEKKESIDTKMGNKDRNVSGLHSRQLHICDSLKREMVVTLLRLEYCTI